MHRNMILEPTYLTFTEVERKFLAQESKHDLFDCLLNHEKACPADIAELYTRLDELYSSTIMEEASSGMNCRCTKIGCLKLYCECFANGIKCGITCECSSCCNKVGYEVEIYEAKMVVNFKHPDHFEGVPALVPSKKCTCKKTMC